MTPEMIPQKNQPFMDGEIYRASHGSVMGFCKAHDDYPGPKIGWLVCGIGIFDGNVYLCPWGVCMRTVCCMC